VKKSYTGQALTAYFNGPAKNGSSKNELPKNELAKNELAKNGSGRSVLVPTGTGEFA
jgi:hypothetical protein